MAFGDEFRYEVSVADLRRESQRKVNAARWNEAAGNLIALRDVLDLQTEYGVALLAPDAEAAVRQAFTRDADTVEYLGNYPFNYPGHDQVSDRRTIAAVALLAGIIEAVSPIPEPHK